MGVARTFRNLRLVRSDALAEYLTNSMVFRWLGNLSFADFIGHDPNGKSESMRDSESLFREPYVLYHSWLDGFVELSQYEAAGVAAAIGGRIGEIDSRHEPLLDRLQKRGWLDDVPVDLEQLVNKCIGGFTAIQNRYEMRQFLELVLARRPQRVLEIGTARGGMLYGLSQVAQPDTMCTSIDLIGGKNGGGQTEIEREVFATFGPPTQRFHFIAGDSKSIDTITQLHTILGEHKLDVIFIDGEHSFEAVSADFNNYQHFVAADGIIAFHDICMLPQGWGPGAGVGLFWNELSHKYKTQNIIDPIGVQVRSKSSRENWAFGIGLVSGRAILRE